MKRTKSTLGTSSSTIKNCSKNSFFYTGSIWLHLKDRRVLYFSIAFILILLWYSPFLISKKVGIFDTKKDLFFFAYLGQYLKNFCYPFFFIAPPWNVARYPTLVTSHALFANPEVFSFSPHMIFLPFLSPVHFVKIHFALHFLVGVLGIYLLSKRLNLRLECSLGLLVLILLNPWYLQHLAIGYYPWINATLFPLIVGLLIPKEKRRYDIYLAGLVNALILYQGGLHLFFWLNSTILLVSIVSCLKYRSISFMVRIFGFYCITFFVALPKLALVASVYKGMAQIIKCSFNSLEGLWAIFMDCKINPYKLPEAYRIYNINWYDGSLYMGIFFVVLIMISIVLSCIRQKWKVLINEMLVPSIIIIIVSWGNNWRKIVSFFDTWTETILGRPIYILHAEKYPWRFLFIAVLLMSVFAMVELSSFISRIKKRNIRVTISCTFCVLLFLIAQDLWCRNNYFSQVATSSYQAHGKGLDMKAYFSKIPVLKTDFQPMRVTWQNGNLGPNKIEIPAKFFSQTDIIILPWLKSSDISLFKAENCEIGHIKLPSYIRMNTKKIKNTWLGKDRNVVTVRIFDRKKNVILTYKKGLFFATLIIGFFGLIITFVIPMTFERMKNRCQCSGTG